MSNYQHFIGGKYDNPTRFINEAKVVGWSRNVNAHFARGLRYGDRIVFLRLRRDKSVQAFVEGQVTSITFKNPELAKRLGKKLQDEGKAEYNPASLGVQRECGSYLISGTYDIQGTDIPEIVRIALELAKEHNLDTSCMIGGNLSKEYDHPAILQPAPKFTRGFIRVDEDESYEPSEVKQVLTIENYHRK